MAKVTGPLHSFDASGRLAGMVFITGGLVRQHVIPANPRTASQMNQRQKMVAAGTATHKLGPTRRQQLQANDAFLAGKPAKYWPSIFVQTYLNYLNNPVGWNALPANVKDLWEAQATAKGLTEVSFPNATDPVITPGLVLHSAARLLYGVGQDNGGSLNDPNDAAANVDAWSAFIVG